jgi:two-component system, OmpR family, phosphate regulon response regulator PhoB
MRKAVMGMTVATMAQQQRRRGSMGRLLVVDDDEDVRRVLVRMLEDEGYSTSEAESGLEVKTALAEGSPELILLDLMLSGEDGFDVLADIRRTSDVPVIILSARMNESDRVLGLRLGADDYVVKPFSGAELSARVASVLRRYAHTAPAPAVVEFGDLTIDSTSREVRLRGELIETTMKEFDLLAFLAASPRQVFSREQLLDHVWGSSSAWQDDGTVTEHIRRIRQKLRATQTRDRWIRTVRGVGYRFEP